ncbi:MAG TPA: hypothetical protein DDX54_04490 [Rhodospirillaceae bacterium]|jgi:hypothetical protein|nr:hypothetical protein [Alphaproteobacteria bacterium]HBH26641.1 hypothetical protein [Rhodospirillaceae bacterium]
MRLSLKALCDKLAVGRTLHPYETQPWAHYDAERGLTCSAEVRGGPGLEDVEAEIQLVRDEDAPPEPPPIRRSQRGDDDDDDGGDGGQGGGGVPPTPPGVPEQVYILRAAPSPADGEWEVKRLFVRAKDYTNAFGEWDEKGCAFFRACVQALLKEEIPDFDRLIEEELQDDDFFGGGRRGRVGRKAPKAQAAQLMGMKKGM